MLTYNQNGTSRGIASIVFSNPGTAAKAAKDLNGLLVDGRPMKVRVVGQTIHDIMSNAISRLKLLSTLLMLRKSQRLSL